MARLLCLVVCFSISLWFEACVPGSNAGPTITFERTNMIGSEGDIFSFHLIAIGTFDDDFSVEVMVEPLTATHLRDYALVANPSGNTTLANFTVGQTSSSLVMINLTTDNAWESLECFTVRIMIPPGVEAMLGSPDSTRVCINDDDEVELSFMEDSLMVIEGMGVISLQLKAEGIYTTCFNVTVICLDIFPVQARVSGLRNNETDAYPNSFTVQFCDLGSSETLSTEMTININDDLVSEPTECFICLILRPFGTRGINVKDPDTLTVCIKDNDVPCVSFVDSNVTGGEGDVVKLRVNRTGCIARKLKCKVRIESTTASKGVDFRVKTKSVVFKKLNVCSEVRTVRVKLLSGNTNCFRVVLKCKPKDLIGCNKPSATVCIQGN